MGSDHLESSRPEQNQNSFEDYSEIFSGIKKKWTLLRTFWNTRKAVLAGEPLYNLNNTELRSRRFMGPWAFGLTKSIAPVGIYAPVIAASISLISSAAYQDPVSRLGSTILMFCSPIIIPLSLLCLVFATAFASLPRGFVNRANWSAAQRKYLYVNGSYGLWPQLLLALGTPILVRSFSASSPDKSGMLFGLAAMPLGIGTIWEGLLWYRIQRSMFEYDYLQEDSSMFSSLREAPFIKFYAVSAMVVPWISVAIFVAILSIANVAAKLVVHFLY